MNKLLLLLKKCVIFKVLFEKPSTGTLEKTAMILILKEYVLRNKLVVWIFVCPTIFYLTIPLSLDLVLNLTPTFIIVSAQADNALVLIRKLQFSLKGEWFIMQYLEPGYIR